MWTLDTPVGELFIRGTFVYFFVFVLMRIWGKKHFGEMAPFDLIVLLIMSETVQNALVRDERSLIGSAIVLLTLFFWNVLMNRIVFHSRKMEKVLAGEPQVLVRDGRIDEKVRKKEQVTDQELLEALRQEGVMDISKVKQATIETNGHITIIRNP